MAFGFGLLAFCLHAACAGRYDLFRDELYFIVCGRHPAFGYVDQPPGVPLLAAALYGAAHNLWLVRLPATLAAGALAWLAARFARLLGGGSAAAAGAALSVTIAPMLMGLGAALATTVFEPLAWTAVAYTLVQAIKTGATKSLWLCGLIAGLALEFKYALVFWGASLLAGLILTPERRLLARGSLWVGAALAALIAAPSAIWQSAHGLPFLELAAAAREKNADTPPAAFVLNQILVMNPVLAPLWLTGLAAPFLLERLRPARFVSIGFVVCGALVIFTHGKDYYLAAAYPTLFVLGATAGEPWLKTAVGRLAGAIWVASAMAVSAALAPLALPVLSLPDLKAYVQRLPLRPQQQEKGFKGALLPQLFADQIGWRDFAAQVGDAFARIPPEERARTAIKVDNYGEAAALDIYGGPYDLPPALAGHNQYYLWGLRGQRPANLLVVQNHPERLTRYCLEARIVGATHSPDAMAYENRKAIAYCHGLKRDLRALWPDLKHYD